MRKLRTLTLALVLLALPVTAVQPANAASPGALAVVESVIVASEAIPDLGTLWSIANESWGSEG